MQKSILITLRHRSTANDPWNPSNSSAPALTKACNWAWSWVAGSCCCRGKPWSASRRALAKSRAASYGIASGWWSGDLTYRWAFERPRREGIVLVWNFEISSISDNNAWFVTNPSLVGGTLWGFENRALIPFFFHPPNPGVVAKVSFYLKS